MGVAGVAALCLIICTFTILSSFVKLALWRRRGEKALGVLVEEVSRQPVHKDNNPKKKIVYDLCNYKLEIRAGSGTYSADYSAHDSVDHPAPYDVGSEFPVLYNAETGKYLNMDSVRRQLRSSFSGWILSLVILVICFILVTYVL